MGDLFVLTNVNGSVFGQITFVNTGGLNRSLFNGGEPLDVNQPTAASGNLYSLDNRPGNPGVFPPTAATRVKIITYYLDNTDPLHPKLMRRTNDLAAQVVAEDIYNLQFRYDLFDYNLLNPTVNVTTTTSPNQIRAVEISIEGRSAEVSAQTADFYRFGLVSKVNVRNSTFRNRYN